MRKLLAALPEAIAATLANRPLRVPASGASATEREIARRLCVECQTSIGINTPYRFLTPTGKDCVHEVCRG